MRILIIALMILVTSVALSQEQNYFFTYLNRNPNRAELPEEEVNRLQEGHMKNIGRLHAEGKLLVAGPFDGGGGLFIFRAAGPDEVQEMLNTDPAVQANRFILETMAWDQKIGGICPVGEDYKMVTYHFIRFRLECDSASDTQKEQFVNYFDRDSMTAGFHVIAVSLLNEGVEAIAILDGEDEVTRTVINDHPSVTGGTYKAEFKKLYVAKGSFCE